MDKLNVIVYAAATLKDRQIEVVASTTGNMLRNGDVLAPSCFKRAVLNDFNQNGAILVGHDWDDLPIGFPVSATMSGDQLVSAAQFHGTEKGEEALTIARERMENGKSVSVSIGFMPSYESIGCYTSGKDLWTAAEQEGYDMTQFDPKIKAYKFSCRLIREVSELFEWSIVLVGMNQRAKATMVNNFDGNPSHGMDFETHLEFSLGGIQRALDIEKMRHESGRTLSADRKAIIAQIVQIGTETLALGEKQSASEPTKTIDLNELYVRALSHTANAVMNR